METGDLTEQDVANMGIIERAVEDIMRACNIPFDDSTRNTPERVAKMYYMEIFSSRTGRMKFPKMTAQPNDMNYRGKLTERSIPVFSVCEHHLVPIVGTATVSYVPRDKIIGLSKLNRIVDYYCRRPQVQERLTVNIADKMQEVLGTPDVSVEIASSHYCIKMRGVRHQGCDTITEDKRGVFGVENLSGGV